jgi:hypothetical protein
MYHWGHGLTTHRQLELPLSFIEIEVVKYRHRGQDNMWFRERGGNL